MASIEINGARLDTIERGSGEPLVLVHGSSSDRRTWDGQLEALGRGFRVIAYSRRYHWPNQPIAHGDDYSMPEHVADLEGLIQRLELSPAHLIGHSYGGFICLLLAIRNPGNVRVVGSHRSARLSPRHQHPTACPRHPEVVSAATTHGPRRRQFGARGLAPAVAAIRRGDRDEALRLLGSAILGPETFRRLSPERLAQARANLIDAELLGSLFPPLTTDQVRGVRCPVLLVEGERSPRVLSHLTSLLGRLLPDVEHVSIPSASHLAHEDEPAAFASAVVSFLTGSHAARV
jgi:pimeloyl-ACP methyl ester carboxylesterase